MQAQDQQMLARFGIDANGNQPKGIEVGRTAPDFNTKDIDNHPVHLKEMLKEGPVVLIFYRGVWCPVCNRYLSNLQDSLQQILATGAKVVAVTPETADNAHKTASNTGAKFIIVSSGSENIMNDYDVTFSVTEDYQNRIRNGLKADIAINNDQDEAKLPVPATYIIDRSGKIVYRQFNPDYHQRATVKEMLENIPRS